MSMNIIQLLEEAVKNKLKELVRNRVEKPLNELQHLGFQVTDIAFSMGIRIGSSSPLRSLGI